MSRIIPAVYKQLAQGDIHGAVSEALEKSSRGWSKLKESRIRDRSHNALENGGLRYPKLRYPDSIRILELQPAVTISSPLTGRLRSSRIEESTYNYEALSYVWGNVSQTVDLYCEGRVIGITQNLDSALRHVRYSDRPRYLWVDAICINQSDTAERGHQVRLMRSIYKSAWQVLVWIGEDQPYQFTGLERSLIKPELDTTTKATHAFEIISHIYDRMHVKYPTPNLDKIRSARLDQKDREFNLSIERMNDKYATVKQAATKSGIAGPMDWEYDVSIEKMRWQRAPVYNATWEVIEEFFSAAWFGRQWIIQEVVVATSVTVLWGNRQIAWTKVGEVAQWLKKYHPEPRHHLIAGAYNASYIYTLAMDARRANRLHHMSTVVASAWNSQASDPRDKIYAMLGLPNLDSDPDHGDLFLEPDYSLTTRQVYTAFARRVIAKEQTLRLFSTVQHDPKAGIAAPSWVPQWEPPRTEPLLPFGIVVNRMPPFDLFEDPLRPWDTDMLSLRGVTIDTVADRSRPRSSYAVDVDQELGWTTIIYRVEQILNAQSRQLTLGVLKVLCWTLTVGRGNDLWGNHINHWDTFQALWLEARRNFSARTWHLIGEHLTDDSDRSYSLHDYLGSATYGRCIFITRNGNIGLGPAILKPDDIVVLLFGGFTPYVLRPIDDHYVLVGECYVHGQMEGAGIEEWHEQGEEAEIFVLR